MDAKTVITKIDQYLQVGGLFNPEMMDHDQVRDLIMECRSVIVKLDYDLGIATAKVTTKATIDHLRQ